MRRFLLGAAGAAIAISSISPASAQFGMLGGLIKKQAQAAMTQQLTAQTRAVTAASAPAPVAYIPGAQIVLTPEAQAYAAKRPEPLRNLYGALYMQGENMSVLNYERIALAAMELGYYKEAEQALDQALNRIEAVYAKDAQAERARSLFRKESNKDYKGEPYERAMAFYYRGLLYLRAGDYENARASFDTAEFQDTVSEEENYQSDFAVMDYLSGWASHCLGQDSKAKDYFASATKANAKLVAPKPDDNLLMLAELGYGPRKIKGGAQRELLTFAQAEGADEDGAMFALSGMNPAKSAKEKPTVYNAQFQPMLASSVWEQATTRGGRPVQGILNGKAQFKDVTGKIGDVGGAVGNELLKQGLSNNNSSMGQLGMGLAAASFLFKAASSAARADADVRAWDTLPNSLYVATGRAPAGFKTSMKWMKQNAALTLTPTPVMQAEAGKCSVAWSRSRSATTSLMAPGIDEGVMKSRAKNKPAVEKDKVFRVALMEE